MKTKQMESVRHNRINLSVNDIGFRVVKSFRLSLLLFTVSFSGGFLVQTAHGQKADDLNVVLVTDNPVQEMTKRLLLGDRGADIKPAASKLTIDEVRRVTRLAPGVASAVRNLAGCTTNTLARNDDGSTSAIPLPFGINFFGANFSQTYVNNNGNITFTAPLGSYTPFGLVGTSTPIIAPFFADVDTNNVASGVVQYGNTSVDGRQAFCVNYVNVGYYSQRVDKLNTFQVILIDRTNTGAGNFDIEFNYNQILWETGEASGGVGGLGGSSARAGYSNGTTQAGASFELPGSAVNGRLLDADSGTGLTNTSRNSGVLGRHVFLARSGIVVPSCPATIISYGQTFSGILNTGSCILSNNNKADAYSFTGTAGQQIAVSVNTTGFFSGIDLLDPQGTVVTSAGGFSGVNNSRLPSSGYFTLPSSGTYTVRAVAAFGGGGSYTVSLYQAPTQACTYSLSVPQTNVPAAGGVFNFDVISQPNCPPAAQPAASGVIYNNVVYNGGRVTFNVFANTGAARSDTITVAGLTHTISQYSAAAPGNDNFGSSQGIFGINSPPNAPVTGYNASATAEAGEPAHAGNTAAKSVWYAWTPPASGSGLYSFSTSGSSFDTVMAIYACPSGGGCSLANIIPIGSNDDTTAFDRTSKVNFRANEGTQYRIAIDGKNGATGTIELSWRQYERLFRLYLQNFNGNQSPITPDTVTASNGSNTVIPLRASQGVYEFNLPADNTVYNVTITGPTGIVWNPNNFPLDTSPNILDELMQGPLDGAQNSVSNAQNQTPRYVYGYIRNITAAELPSLSVAIGASRGNNPRDAVSCSPLGSTVISAVPYATYQCLSQPQTLHDIMPSMSGKNFTASVLSFDRPINTNEYGLPSSGFAAANVPTYNITGRVLSGGAGTTVDLSYTPPGNTLEITQRTQTDATGNYAFRNLPANGYRLKAARTGFVFDLPASINLQSSQTVDITAQASCVYTPANLAAIAVGGGLNQFMVATNDQTCGWLASSDVSWIAINSGAIVGSGPVHFTAQANTGAGRIGSIRVAGRPDPVYVQQSSTNPTFASVNGRVTTPDGRALRNAVVTLIDINGTRQTALTSSFGLFTLANVETGQILTAIVTSKRYRFTARTLLFTGTLSNVDFVGLE